MEHKTDRPCRTSQTQNTWQLASYTQINGCCRRSPVFYCWTNLFSNIKKPGRPEDDCRSGKPSTALPSFWYTVRTIPLLIGKKPRADAVPGLSTPALRLRRRDNTHTLCRTCTPCTHTTNTRAAAALRCAAHTLYLHMLARPGLPYKVSLCPSHAGGKQSAQQQSGAHRPGSANCPTGLERTTAGCIHNTLPRPLVWHEGPSSSTPKRRAGPCIGPFRHRQPCKTQ